jgi:hypothetical protein
MILQAPESSQVPQLFPRTKEQNSIQRSMRGGSGCRVDFSVEFGGLPIVNAVVLCRKLLYVDCVWGYHNLMGV